MTWEAVDGADAYLVERHGPQGPRVLGRTSMLEWTDSAPKDGGITWTVRALRGQNASSAPVTAASDAPEPEPEPDTPGVKDFAAIAGRPVVLSWRAPDGAKLTLTRRRDDVTRAISPDHDGYVDRKVQAGATYEYTVTIDGMEGSERSATVTVPSDAPVAAPAARPGSPSWSSGAATTGAWRRPGRGRRAPPRSSSRGTGRRRRARPAPPAGVRSPTPATRSTVARRWTACRLGRISRSSPEAAPQPELWSGASTLRPQRVGWCREQQPTRGDGRRPAERSRRAPGAARHEHRRPLSQRGAQAARRRDRAREARHRAGPFDTTNPTLKRSDAGYALLEAARAYFGFAVRLRSRVTGQHASRAGEPLRAGLRKLAEDVEPQDARQLLLSAAHALIVCSRASEIASHPESVSGSGHLDRRSDPIPGQRGCAPNPAASRHGSGLRAGLILIPFSSSMRSRREKNGRIA